MSSATVPPPPRTAPAPPSVLAGWDAAHRGTAVLGIVLLGAQIRLPMNLSAGFLVAAALLPVWLPALWRSVGGRALMITGVLGVVAGLVLTVQERGSLPAAVPVTINVVGLLCGIGLLVWSRTLMSAGVIGLWFGVGLVVDIANGGALFESNPWRFGFSIPVTVVVLAVAHILGKRLLEVVLLLVLAGVAAVTDARSGFVILLATAILVAWQARPVPVRSRSSTAATLIGVTVLLSLMYLLGEALFLGGALGEETAERSRAQVEASGSLIFGGRPELAATTALLDHQLQGFGSGTKPGPADVLAAKEGMASVGYDPDNGYVERYMFGSGFELHSVFGDLWAHFGIMGLVLAAVVLAITMGGLARGVAGRSASALIIYLTAKTVWNVLFSPLYSSIPLLILTLGLLVLLPGAVPDRVRAPAGATP